MSETKISRLKTINPKFLLPKRFRRSEPELSGSLERSEQRLTKLR